jgi:NhaP-type Na+/H+ or K+/H+ antiporter
VLGPRTTPEFERLALAALAVVAWAVAGEAGGNGLIAAFVGGGAAGMAVGALRDRMLGFTEEDGQLLNPASAPPSPYSTTQRSSAPSSSRR